MPVNPQLLEILLRTPESRDVTDSALVRTVVLQDPANAAQLVPALDEPGTLQSQNARRILCLFNADAVPPLLKALASAGADARKEGVEIVWTILFGESPASKRATLSRAASDLEVLLDDKRALPDHMPEYIERDFQGRICDLTFMVVQELLDEKYDPSLFRSLDDDGRDEEIDRLKRRGFGYSVA
jgi:hypothetical protein